MECMKSGQHHRDLGSCTTVFQHAREHFATLWENTTRIALLLLMTED